VSVAYVDLVDVAIAAAVTGLEVDTLMRVAKLDLADSALHAPAAGFGDVKFYPEFVDKAAVLVVHLAKNHPLPDGNKRAAWVTLASSLTPTAGPGPRHRPSMTPSTPSSLSPQASGTRRPWPTGCAHNSTPRASRPRRRAGSRDRRRQFRGSHQQGQHRVVCRRYSRVLLADPFPTCKVISVGGHLPDSAPNSKRHVRISAHVNVADNTGRMPARIGADGEDRDPKWPPNGFQALLSASTADPAD
jgi:death-on-curing protein